MTVGGLVAAKAAGLDEGDLRGILGIEDDKTAIEESKTNKTTDTAADVNFKEVKEYSGKKAEAKTLIKTPHELPIKGLDANNE